MSTNMDWWTKIRLEVLRGEVSKREVLRREGIHWETLKKVLPHSEPPGYRMAVVRSKPKIGPYLERIAQIIDQNKSLPKKQRHTARRIYQRLLPMGYQGGYTQVKEAVRKLKRSRREVFMPLVHRPGEAQVDFGYALVKMGGRLRKVAFSVMEQICLDFPRYGYRRVAKQLQREGWIINHKKVAQIMREKGWSCRPRKRKWISTTDSNHNFRVYPNLIQDRSVDGINQLWVADITHIHLLVCFIYLTVILDVYSRKAIGYGLSRNLDTQLTLSALRMAIDQRNPAPGCIHHSDRGVQYVSKDYIKELEFYKFQISMSRKGNPFGNAYAESFIKTLMSEEVHLWEYRTIEDAQRRIPYFIEDVYNHKRLHSAIGYCPPSEFEFLLESTPNPSQDTLIRAI